MQFYQPQETNAKDIYIYGQHMRVGKKRFGGPAIVILAATVTAAAATAIRS